MTTALEGGEGTASRPGRSLPPGKTRYSLYRRLGGSQDRSGQVQKISPPPGFDPRTVQPLASRYTDYTTRPTAREVRSRLWAWPYSRLYPFLPTVVSLFDFSQTASNYWLMTPSNTTVIYCQTISCSQGATCFDLKDPSIGLIETKPGFTINDSCVGARIRQRLYIPHIKTNLIVIHQTHVKVLVPNQEHNRFFLPQIHYRSHKNPFSYRNN
jgi:hypothetical protein